MARYEVTTEVTHYEVWSVEADSVEDAKEKVTFKRSEATFVVGDTLEWLITEVEEV